MGLRKRKVHTKQVIPQNSWINRERNLKQSKHKKEKKKEKKRERDNIQEILSPIPNSINNKVCICIFMMSSNIRRMCETYRQEHKMKYSSKYQISCVVKLTSLLRIKK